jgi:hypothetical protein
MAQVFARIAHDDMICRYRHLQSFPALHSVALPLAIRRKQDKSARARAICLHLLSCASDTCDAKYIFGRRFMSQARACLEKLPVLKNMVY